VVLAILIIVVLSVGRHGRRGVQLVVHHLMLIVGVSGGKIGRRLRSGRQMVRQVKAVNGKVDHNRQFRHGPLLGRL